MEFLKTITKRRSLVSEIVYIGLNVGLAVILLLVVRYTSSIAPALVIVLLSKWRVFAVRTRFWLANIQDNAVCFIVSLGYVVFLFNTNPSTADSSQNLTSLITQIALALLYIVWLIWLKPKSKRSYIVAQAGVALFVGITAIFMMSYSWIALPVVFLVWLVGYVSARHVLGSYDESHIILLSLVFAFIVSEIGWLAYHWTVAYQVPFSANILIPQASIIVLAYGFLAEKAYGSFYHNQKIRMNDIILPLLFAIGITTVLILFRNGIDQSIF